MKHGVSNRMEAILIRKFYSQAPPIYPQRFVLLEKLFLFKFNFSSYYKFPGVFSTFAHLSFYVSCLYLWTYDHESRWIVWLHFIVRYMTSSARKIDNEHSNTSLRCKSSPDSTPHFSWNFQLSNPINICIYNDRISVSNNLSLIAQSSSVVATHQRKTA